MVKDGAVFDAMVEKDAQADARGSRKRGSDRIVEGEHAAERLPTRRRLMQTSRSHSALSFPRNNDFPTWPRERPGSARPPPLSTESLLESSFQATLNERAANENPSSTPASRSVSQPSQEREPERATPGWGSGSTFGETSHFDRARKISKDMPPKELTRKGIEIWRALVNELKEAVLRQMEPANLARSVLNPRSAMRAYYESLSQANRDEELGMQSSNGNVRSPRESIWRSSFLTRDRGLTPRPIVDMSFERLGRLLYTKGCTNPACTAERTEYIMWEFGERYCHRCIQELTIPTSQLRSEQPLPILDYVPRHVMTGSRVGTILVHREHVARIKDEYKKFQDGSPDAEADAQWRTSKREENEGKCPRMRRFRTWLRYQDLDDRPDYRSERREYLELGAMEQDPELTREILEHIPQFQRSVDDKRFEPTDNSLRTLMPKIQAAKPRVIRMLERRSHDLARQEVRLSTAAILNRDRVRDVLLGIAKGVVDRMATVSPYDFVLRALHDFRVEYFALAEGRPRDIDGDLHTLTIGDALMIFKDVLAPAVRVEDARAALKSFKCGGCRRRVPGQTRHYTFEVLLYHLSQHRDHLDLFDFYSDLPNHFAHWLPWPPRLPVLAEHHLVPTVEDFDRDLDIPYQTRQNNEFDSLSAFEDRTFSNPQDSADDNVADNLLFALRQLLGSELKGDATQFNVKIVFEYVIRRYRSKTATLPPLALLDPALANPEFTRLASVFGKHKCGVCSEDPTKRKGPGAQTFERLVAHWRHTHMNRSEHHWSEALVKLPTDQQLRTVLQPPSSKKAKDPKKAREAFDALFPPLGTLWSDAADGTSLTGLTGRETSSTAAAAAKPSLTSEAASARGSGSLMAFAAAGEFAGNVETSASVAPEPASVSLFGGGANAIP